MGFFQLLNIVIFTYRFKDEKISISYKDGRKAEQTLVLPRVVFYDAEKKRLLQFLTNIFDMTTEEIGLLYKMRWQIELLFKQLKQDFPLKYFLCDNANAIKIQICCTLIANLLFTIVKKVSNKKYPFPTWSALPVSICSVTIGSLTLLKNRKKNGGQNINKKQSRNPPFRRVRGCLENGMRKLTLFT